MSLTKVKPFLFLPFHCVAIPKRLWKESGFRVFENKELRKNKRGFIGGEITAYFRKLDRSQRLRNFSVISTQSVQPKWSLRPS